MKTKKENIIYKAFGLHILSEIPLPELSKIALYSDAPDVKIELADLSSLWIKLSVPNERFVVTDKLVMFRISEAAIFCIQNGNRILVSPMDGADIDRIRLYILGTCMGILLIQNRIYALHGSAIEINGMAYAIVGDSGAGKSTLAAEFLSRGYKLLSDDVIPIAFSQNDQIPMVIPAYPQQKLWRESLLELGMESSHLKPIFGERTKFSVPVSSQFRKETLPLAGIFELERMDNEKIELIPIQSLERVRTLFYHTYRNFIIQRLGMMDWHFNASINILSNSFIFKLGRPESNFTAPELATLILNTIQMEEDRNAKKQVYSIK